MRWTIFVQGSLPALPTLSKDSSGTCAVSYTIHLRVCASAHGCRIQQESSQWSFMWKSSKNARSGPKWYKPSNTRKNKLSHVSPTTGSKYHACHLFKTYNLLFAFEPVYFVLVRASYEYSTMYLCATLDCKYALIHFHRHTVNRHSSGWGRTVASKVTYTNIFPRLKYPGFEEKTGFPKTNKLGIYFLWMFALKTTGNGINGHKMKKTDIFLISLHHHI